MIDFHSHLLPAIDDGSRSLTETEGLLQQEKEQGVTTIVATPHFYASETSFDHFLKKRAGALAKVHNTGLVTVTTADSDEQIHGIRLLPAAEVYYFSGISRADRLGELCVWGTNLLLLEMPFAQWNSDVVQEVENLLYKRKMRVVLAHIERFFAYQKDKRYLQEILDLPLILQVNAGSVKHSNEKRAVKKVLTLDKPIILGSDCHSLHSRPVNLVEGGMQIDKLAGAGTVERMTQTAEQLLLPPYHS